MNNETNLILKRLHNSNIEAYSVFNGENLCVAYIYIKNGVLYAECPDIDGETVYYHNFKDPTKNTFETEEERIEYLSQIKEKIIQWLKEYPNGGIPEIMTTIYNQMMADLRSYKPKKGGRPCKKR